MENVSFLIGAGFSRPVGLPTAKEINQNLVDLKPEYFGVSSAGQIFLLHGKNDPMMSYSYYQEKLFFIDLILFYLKFNEMDYERFYDFIDSHELNNTHDKQFGEFCDNFRKKENVITDNVNLLMSSKRILNQLISVYLNGPDWLVNSDSYSINQKNNYLLPYSGFIEAINNLSKNNIVNIHTLNHDLVFELMISSKLLTSGVSDGFTSDNSVFYGRSNFEHKVLLRYFNNDYTKPVRLYKLHGSKANYGVRDNDGRLSHYVKLPYGFDPMHIMVKIGEGDEGFRTDWFNYHPDFLSGTTSKIYRYSEPIYYKKVFDQFEHNLSNSKSLIIIGYSCADSKVNEVIEQFCKMKGGANCYLIDPYPSSSTKEFCQKNSIHIVEIGVEKIHALALG